MLIVVQQVSRMRTDTLIIIIIIKIILLVYTASDAARTVRTRLSPSALESVSHLIVYLLNHLCVYYSASTHARHDISATRFTRCFRSTSVSATTESIIDYILWYYTRIRWCYRVLLTSRKHELREELRSPYSAAISVFELKTLIISRFTQQHGRSSRVRCSIDI